MRRFGEQFGELLDLTPMTARHKNAPATNVVFPQCLGIYICSSNLALMVGFWEIFLGSPSLTVSGIRTFSREFNLLRLAGKILLLDF